jgi:peptide/nickel transport system substrate-binding protein
MTAGLAVAALAVSLVAGCTAAGPGGGGGGTPQAGGELIYGVPGEPAGFNLTAQGCNQECKLMARTIYDPLMALDENLDAVPYLAESVEPNDDYTAWTITLRPDVVFHDGDPLTAEVVQQNLEAYATPPSLVAGVLEAQFDGFEVVDDLTLVVTMKGSWPTFDLALTGEPGYVVSPKTIASGVDGGLEPIGTGPFVFEEWKQGDHLTVVRNEDYWQEELPYLDSVTFRPIPDAAARTAAFQRGEINAIMTDNPEQISSIEGMADVNLNKSTEAASTDEYVLNVESGPTSDLRVRQALAYAFDSQTYVDVLGAGVVVPANGPFPAGSIGYLEDTGAISFDLDKAKELVEEYESENGPLTLTIQAGQDKSTAVQLAQSMWQEAGMDVELAIADNNVVLTNLLQGNFEIMAGALPGVINPADNAIWWDSANLHPVGEISTNYARIDDPDVDGLLADLAVAADASERQELAADLNRRFAEETYAIWTYWTVWATASASDVHDLVDIELPDGQTSDNTNQGLHFLVRAWIG